MPIRSPVSACMVLYRPGAGAVETAECLMNSDIPVRLYVVDNTPGSPVSGQLRSLYPEAVVLQSKRNVGYGRANNQVLSLLTSTYHLILNPDVRFEPTLLRQMVEYMEAHPDIAILTPRLLNPNGTEQAVPRMRPHFLDLATSLLPFLPGAERRRRENTLTDQPYERPMTVECATGCFLLIRTHYFYRLGGFDERYFLYMEDHDLSLKAARLGKVVYHPGFTVTHEWARADRSSPRLLAAHVFSALQFLLKWGF